MTTVRALSETWRYLRLFAVGIAWATPLILAAGATEVPGVAAYPALSRVTEPLLWPFLLVMPLLAVLGVMVVASLSEPAAPLSWASITPVTLFIAAGAGLAVGFGDNPSFAQFTSSIVVLAVLLLANPAVGVAVTVCTLWRRRPWIALTWAAAWLSVAALAWLAGAHTAEFSDDIGAGLWMVFGLGGVFLASTIASAMAFITKAARPVQYTEQALRAERQEM